jgi:hypothetical protein
VNLQEPIFLVTSRKGQTYLTQDKMIEFVQEVLLVYGTRTELEWMYEKIDAMSVEETTSLKGAWEIVRIQ